VAPPVGFNYGKENIMIDKKAKMVAMGIIGLLIFVVIATAINGFKESQDVGVVEEIESEPVVDEDSLDQYAINKIPKGMCKIVQFIFGGSLVWVMPDLFTYTEGLEVLEYRQRFQTASEEFRLVDRDTDLAELKREVILMVARKSNKKARDNKKPGFKFENKGPEIKFETGGPWKWG
jgi:hypothetical protein